MNKLIYSLFIIFIATSWTTPYPTVNAADVPQSSLTVQSISAGTYPMLALMSDGTVMSWGRNVSGQLGVGGRVTHIYIDMVFSFYGT